jgi:hypothetical protein
MRASISQQRSRCLTAIALTVLLIAAQGCATHGSTAPETPNAKTKTASESCLQVPGVPGDLMEQYNASIIESAVFRPCRQVDELRPVTGRAVMGSLISCFLCGESGGSCSRKCLDSTGEQVMAGDVWVSHGEEVLEHCSQFSDVVLGLQQLLGLPPQLDQPQSSWQMLVVDVPGPQTLFRPCANPDPTTSGPCSEEFPATYPCYDPQGCEGEGLDAKMEAHRAWTAGQAFSSWQIPETWFGYPWTRLGYTYNWNPDAPSIVGTSEYVIPEGTMIDVCTMIPAIEFCAMTPAEVEALCD